MSLTVPMRDLLWQVAQHKYGWTYPGRHGGRLQVADALVRRGLVRWLALAPRDHHHAVITATPVGYLEIVRRWPVSPYVLNTYEPQPGGWTPREGVVA